MKNSPLQFFKTLLGGHKRPFISWAWCYDIMVPDIETPDMEVPAMTLRSKPFLGGGVVEESVCMRGEMGVVVRQRWLHYMCTRHFTRVTLFPVCVLCQQCI